MEELQLLVEMYPLSFLFLILWTLSWKGWALWLSARANQWGWFAVMLFVNTFGIIEIIYIFYFSKKPRKEEKKTEKEKEERLKRDVEKITSQNEKSDK